MGEWATVAKEEEGGRGQGKQGKKLLKITCRIFQALGLDFPETF